MTLVPPRLIDAYAHVGLPRFVTLDDYRGIMERGGIDRAVLCSFDSSPDLTAIHEALSRWPEQFRGIGVPLGRDRSEMQRACEAQFAAGFSGLRLSDADVVERPWLFDVVAAARGFAIVCGQVARPGSARAILGALDRHAGLRVIGGHFAGIDNPAAMDEAPVARLFEHGRFHVVFSRQGAVPDSTILPWAEAIIARTGWDRIMWGSETPILFWRNETMQAAIDWIGRLGPTASQHEAFRAGNALRFHFGEPVPVSPLALPIEPSERARPFPAGTFARGLPLRQDVAGRLVHAWLSEGGEGDLASFTERLLDRVLPPLP
jgi:predicted TIM-barrel fold metal-dependent hydrolase